MDITDQGAQMEPLLPTVRPDSHAAVVFVCKYISSFHIFTDRRRVRVLAYVISFLMIWGATSHQCTT